MLQRISRVLIAALAWTIVGVVFALPDLSGRVSWRSALLISFTQWWAWGLLTPLIIAVDRRLPFSGQQLPRRVAAHLLLSLPFTLVYVYVSAALRPVLGIGTWSALLDPRLFSSALHGMYLWSWLIYWLIIGAWQAYQYYERYLSSELHMERLERRFSEARLNALRTQLDPHFLFNALNTISSQVERDPKLARAMIEHLGLLLRLSLDSKDRQEVSLADEIAFLDHYLAIQKIRFGDHLNVDIRITPEVERAAVPSLVVQPLVENAIRHGISRRSSGGTVTVSAVRLANRLEIRVLDDGVGLPAGWTLENSSGVGLSVTRERIVALHPDGASHFAIHRRAGGGTEAVIVLPLRLLEDTPHDSAA
jgi:two-component system LytT family sensor kinase